MEIIKKLFFLLIHIDKYLGLIVQTCGLWTYLILFLIIFCETGLVITPFLPGDSLLFAVGAFSANGLFRVEWVYLLLILAAFLGDTVNYWLGYFVGPKVFSQEKSRFFKKEYLDRARKFYEKYGGKTIVLARFIPLMRTFAPFVAGIGKMNYFKFLSYNLFGGWVWVTIFVFGGYFFGNIPMIKNNFGIVILIIIFLSILPAVIEVVRGKKIQKIESRK